MLNLHQELLLLAIDDEGNVHSGAGTSSFEQAFCGGCLIDLANLGKIEVDLQQVTVRDATLTGNPTLDSVLGRLQENNDAHDLASKLRLLRPASKELCALTLQSLCDLNILEAREARLFWVLATRQYPIIDGRERTEAKLRIMETLLGDTIPTTEDSVLIGLAKIAGVLQNFLATREIASLEERIDTVSNLDLTAKLVEQAIYKEQEVQAMALLNIMHPTYTE